MQQTRVPESFRQSQGFLTASAAAGETKEIHRWRGETEGEEDWQRVRNREALLKDGWGEWQGGRLEQRNRENLQGLVSFSWRKCPEEWRWKCEGCYVSKWDGRGRKGGGRETKWLSVGFNKRSLDVLQKKSQMKLCRTRRRILSASPFSSVHRKTVPSSSQLCLDFQVAPSVRNSSGSSGFWIFTDCVWLQGGWRN